MASSFADPVNDPLGWTLDPADQTLSLTYTPTPVPEPGTLALVGLAAAGLAGWRRRGQPTSCSQPGPADALSACAGPTDHADSQAKRIK